MTNLTTCRPSGSSSMDRVFNQLWNASSAQTSPDASSVLRPRVDIEESDAEFRLRMDLPGVKREDLKIEIENGTLQIEAERKVEASDDVQVLHRERAKCARYLRRFSLGDSVNTDSIVARFTDGVLELTVPKTEKSLPRRINSRPSSSWVTVWTVRL